MPDEIRLFISKEVQKANDIPGDFKHCVRAETTRHLAQVVAALIGNNDVEARLCQGQDLMHPASPEFGKAMEQDHCPTVSGSGLHDVQLDPIGSDKPKFHFEST